MIAHIDADAFFASVELINRPDLRGKPVMVAGVCSNRGVVTAATYEARKFGVRAGTPVFKARKMCSSGIFLAANFAEYQAVSAKMFRIFDQFSPLVEKSSIDEGFLDLSGLCGLYRTSFTGIAEMIQKRVNQELKITVSVGVALTKILAKMASAHHKPAGLTVVSLSNRPDFLQSCTVNAIPGVGKNTAALLSKLGFQNAWDVAHCSRDILKGYLGKRGVDLWRELNGEPVSLVENYAGLPQSISKSQTMLDFSNDGRFLFGFSVDLLLKATGKMRRYGLSAKRLSYFMRTKGFKTYSAKQVFGSFCQDDSVYIAALRNLFQRLYSTKLLFRSVGVTLSNFAYRSGSQLSIFEYQDERPELMRVLDNLNMRYGSNAVTRATTLFNHQDVHDKWMGSSFEYG